MYCMLLILLSSFVRIRSKIFGLLVPRLRVGCLMCWNSSVSDAFNEFEFQVILSMVFLYPVGPVYSR